jgi:two-component system alkaline phosphatase synthesis response regulator PhoP
VNTVPRTIYCVEDDAPIRELTSYALKSEGFAVEAFETAEALLLRCGTGLPDLILLDIMLPGLDGIEALKTLRQKYKSAALKIIMLTAKTSESYKVNGLDSGADDSITKPFSILELIARVKAHLRTVKKDAAVLEAGGVILNAKSREVRAGGCAVALTAKEFELLRYLMLNSGEVLSREELVKNVWGFEYFGESRTVDIHIKNLREKLGSSGGSIQSVRGVGYIFK